VSSGVHFDFEEVYAAHVDFVWRVLRGMGVPDAIVEDATQDAFVVVHRRLPEFDGRCAIKTWLFEIAYRVACSYRRKGKRAASHEPIEPFDDTLLARGPSPAESAEHTEARRLVEELLDGIDDDKRAVLVLADIEGMSAPEIAVVTATPLNTVYTRLRRARAEFGAALAARQKRKP
jgi:RNA polymerase sigma-70 factor (ECF subfamily)